MKIIGFDTETTGIDVKNDRILSAAIVEDLGEDNFDSKEFIANPGVEIPQASIDVHKMTPEFIEENGRDPKVVLSEIAEKIEEADVVVIYNASFDLPLLENELERHGLPPLSRGTSRKVVDPLILDRHFSRRKGPRRLENAADFYGVTVEGDLHDAVTDVETMLKVFRKQREKYDDVLEWDAEDRFNKQAEWHKKWAENLNKWKGEDVVDRNWLDSRILKKWHVGPNGKGRCRAKYSCPFDDTGEHFETEGEAISRTEEIFSEKHGNVSVVTAEE